MTIKITEDLDLSHVPDMRPDMSPEERKAAWLLASDMTEAEFDALMAENKARQAKVPELGSVAPDFELDILDRSTGRTGDKVRLSDMRSKPVGLIFGSYT